ncbi:hypothetical protein JCM10908_005817 [Rhodotorula pacifica]|uniref:uncharacterized protein n=1 Tax=Rhodotorula pacifica TaxID=1495444 RepID=UPI0031746241
MPTASKPGRDVFTTLPPELLSHILSSLQPPNDTPDTVEGDALRIQANKDLLAVTRSCRTLSEAALPILYAKPIFLANMKRNFYRQGGDIDRELKKAAMSFVKTLEEHEELAGYVRDLSMLNTVVPAFETSRQGQLQKGLIAACDKVETIAVKLRTAGQSAELGTLLASLPRLRSLKLDAFPRTAQSKDSAAELYDACLCALKQNYTAIAGAAVKLEHLSLFGVGGRLGSAAANRLSTLSSTLQNLTDSLFVEVHRYDQDLAVFLPGPLPAANTALPGLAALHISTSRNYEGNDTAPGLSADLWSNNTLASFSAEIRFFRGKQILRNLTTTNYHSAVQPVLAKPYERSFSRFPQARRLRLSYGFAMTLEKLNALANASLQLEELDLENTYWSLTSADFGSSPSNVLSDFERSLIVTLDSFKHLKYVRLGVWPYVADASSDERTEGRSALDAWARNEGLELHVRGCRS